MRTVIGNCQLLCGDCLDLMGGLESADMVFCDLPYGTTYCKWDAVIPFDALWESYKKAIKPGGAIVLTAGQPFTSALVMSNPDWFRAEWIWDKKYPTNFANSKRHPMKVHESVLVFASAETTYNPQRVPGAKNHVQGKSTVNRSETRLINGRSADDLSGLKFPRSIQEFPKHSSQCGLHPTQKPVSLVEYFIKTYSNPGDVVLDNCMGSGTTGAACLSTGRRFLGIEKNPDFFRVACERIEDIVRQGVPS